MLAAGPEKRVYFDVHQTLALFVNKVDFHFDAIASSSLDYNMQCAPLLSKHFGFDAGGVAREGPIFYSICRAPLLRPLIIGAIKKNTNQEDAVIASPFAKPMPLSYCRQH